MIAKKDEGFLTLEDACDTINIIAGMDYAGMVMNSEELIHAMISLLNIEVNEIPESMLPDILDARIQIRNLLGIGSTHENFGGGTRPTVFNV